MLKPPALPPAAIDDLVRDFTTRLHDVMAEATRRRGLDLIDKILAAVRAPASAAARRRKERADRRRNRVLATLTAQLLRDLEQATRLNVREAVQREWAARTSAGGDELAPRRPSRRPRRRPLPPPPDPEQLKRDAEVARLRALLRPADEELPPPPPVPVAPPIQRERPTTPGEQLHALEKEIQEAVPGLAQLGPERCGAQIAAWAGRVRDLRDRLSPELSALMRPAIRIFIEHLTGLRTALDATFVDALDPKWHPPSWSIYIEANQARALGRAPALDPDQVVAHHRAMLKALVQPHRRHVPDQAAAVINAAAEVLPPSDGQLRSAIRRHAAALSKHQPRLAQTEDPAGALAETAEPPTEIAEEESNNTGATDAIPPSSPEPAPAPAPTPPPAEAGEFDQPWTK